MCTVEMSDLSNDTKKHTMKSRETIPLSKYLLLLKMFRFSEYLLNADHSLLMNSEQQ
jgi:hypothetical protein